MRLIDADALKNDINAQVAILNSMSVSTGIDELRQIGEELQRGMVAEIDKQPTVDAVPVVRCKNCIQHEEGFKTKSGRLYCCYLHVTVDPMGYCDNGDEKHGKQ